MESNVDSLRDIIYLEIFMSNVCGFSTTQTLHYLFKMQ